MQFNNRYCNFVFLNDQDPIQNLHHRLKKPLTLTYSCTGSQAGTEETHIMLTKEVNIEFSQSLILSMTEIISFHQKSNKYPFTFEIEMSHTEHNDDHIWKTLLCGRNGFFRNKRVNLYLTLTHSRAEMMESVQKQLSCREILFWLNLCFSVMIFIIGIIVAVVNPFITVIFWLGGWTIGVRNILANRDIDNPHQLDAVLPCLEKL